MGGRLVAGVAAEVKVYMVAGVLTGVSVGVLPLVRERRAGWCEGKYW